MHIERRLEEMGLELPEPIKLPEGMRLPFQWVRMRGNRAYISGHGPLRPDGSIAGPFGKLGGEVTVKQAYVSARLTALNMLASLKRELGDLGRETAWLRVFGMVNTVPGLTQQPAAINGFSDLILELYGPEAGQHVRSVVGIADVPQGLPVEIEAEVEIAG